MMTRREMLRSLTAGTVLIGATPLLLSAEARPRKRLGVCTYSYGIHWRAARDGAQVPFRDTLEFIDYCHTLGAGGVQIALGSKEPDYARRARAKCEQFGMYYEGQVTLPKSDADLDRFATDVRLSKEAGANLVRAAALSGRRYETFDSGESFRAFAEQSWKSVSLAEPVLKMTGVKLALENHKDWRAEEFVQRLKTLSSEWIGVCVDTGNNVALLEEPHAVVEALAPFALSSHLKDMAVEPNAEGFLLSEVPLGEGFLDVKRIIQTLEKANPRIQFNLEMITRDPLRIPCLTEKYWATMPGVLARELAAALALVKEKRSAKPLPRTAGLQAAQQRDLEDRHVRQSFHFAPEKFFA
jgi:sugar phosphate isomerase/epimerase